MLAKDRLMLLVNKGAMLWLLDEKQIKVSDSELYFVFHLGALT